MTDYVIVKAPILLQLWVLAAVPETSHNKPIIIYMYPLRQYQSIAHDPQATGTILTGMYIINITYTTFSAGIRTCMDRKTKEQGNFKHVSLLLAILDAQPEKQQLFYQYF